MALANAREFAGVVDQNQPSTVDAILALFTDFHRGEKDQFVWLVSYRGVIYR